VVIFCSIVVAFFVTLNVYILASLIAWRGARKKKLGARWKPLWPRAKPSAGGPTVRGRVERIGSSADTFVVRDFWADAATSFRVTECAVFLVKPDDPRAPTAVIACTTAPDLVGHATPSTVPQSLEAMSPEARPLVPVTPGPEPHGVLLTIAEGDHVEVHAASSAPIENLDRIVLPGGEVLVQDVEGTPYRDALDASPRAASLFLDSPDTPFTIRRLS
jgi:hypothetical protein